MPIKCCCSSFFCCFSGNNTQSSSPAVVTTLPASTSNDASSSSVPTHNDSGPSGDPSSSTSTVSELTYKIIKDGGNNTQSSSSAQPPANNSANNNASPAVVTSSLPASSSQDDASSSSSAKCGLSSSVPTHNDSGPHEAPASGDPSSSTSMMSELTKKIIEDGKNDDITLDGLIEDISKLFEIIKTKSSDKKPSTDKYWPSSSFFLKLKETLSEAADGVSALKDIMPAKTVVQDLLKGIGQAHWAVAGLLVVANILERFETLSANQNECLNVLEEMRYLAQRVKELQKRSGLKKAMETSIERATEMIVEGALMCCTQMSASRISMFFSSTVNKEDLAKFQQRLQITYRRMDDQMLICILDAVESKNVRPPVKGRERSYPEYAVGIEEHLKEVTDLLEWESHKNVVAVMVHGFGGMGKTTLADAVFARLYIEGCKYSMVRLFDDINSTPNIIELQKCILKDLMLGSREEDQKSMLENIRTFEDGQREIGRMLEKEVAFIYIDNALHKDPLEKLLPKGMEKSRKCRLVITTRDKAVRKGCSMDDVKSYPVKYLPSTEAMILLKQELNYEDTDNRKRLNSDQLHRIVNLCGGVPKLLSVLARFVRYDDRGQQKAFSIVMKDMEEKKEWNVEIGDIGSYLFAYDHLPERVKDPFLDICSFFNGWDWDEVTDIVGESNLDVLEKRGLVNKDREMTVTVHDVILTISYKKTKGTRFIFNSKSEIEEFLKKDIQGIKGIWLNDIQGIKDIRLNHIHTISIPATKLNCMSHSLRILALGGSAEVDGTCEKIFEEIIFFQGEVPHLPFHVSHSKELKYLRYEPHDWNLLKEMPSNLKHMELNGRLHSEDAFKILSSDLQQRRSLRTLKLVNFARLKNLPEVWAILSHCLQKLDLSDCGSLEELPGSISKLQSLTELDMRNCSSLKRLPEDFGSLTSLQKFYLSGCNSLEELPGSISKLQSLTKLNICNCSSLKRLPEAFGSLTSLQNLYLSGCSSLEELPGSISKLQSLTKLNMRNCSSLKRLPEDFGSLTSFQNLDLSDCNSLEELPGSISKLQSLTKLDMRNCSSLKRLPEDFGSLNSLQKLDLSGCNSLEELPGSISKLQSLTKLDMRNCSSLKRLPEDFGSLTSLQNLDLSGCNSLEELPGSKIDLSGFESLEELPG